MKYQIHKCSSYCQRIVYRNKRPIKICRNGFPRPAQAQTTLNTVEAALKSRTSGNRIKKLYNLKRSINEQYVNDYHEKTLLAWEANTDIQYIGEESMALDRYISSYITKKEKNATHKIYEDCNKSSSLKSKLYKHAMQTFKSRECGIYEAFDKLYGAKMCEFSHQVYWLNTNMYNKRTRRLKDRNEILKMNEEDTKIFFDNIVDTYYPNRPLIYEDMSLYHFASWYDHKKVQCSTTHTLCFALNDNHGFMHLRSEPKVIQTTNIKCISPESTEEYFHQLLIMFLPWRHEKAPAKLN